MKTTIELGKEVGAEFEPVNSEILHSFATEVYIFSTNSLHAFRKACEADFISRCEFMGYERKGMLFNEDDISTESLYTKLYTLPKE